MIHLSKIHSPLPLQTSSLVATQTRHVGYVPSISLLNLRPPSIDLSAKPLSAMTVKSSVLEIPSLTKRALEELIAGRVLAIRVPKYLEENVCREVSAKVNAEKYEYYDYAQGVVGRYGMSFSEIGSRPAKFYEYYSRAMPEINKIRSIFCPYLSPIDRLRLNVDEVWPSGGKIEEFYVDRKSFVGLLRVIDPNKIVLPHQDVIAWDACRSLAAETIRTQLAVNVYLQMPQTGGDLELWDHGITDLKEYEAKAKGSYGIVKEDLPSPSVALKPKEGELIIFKPTNLHCILPGSEARLTQSCFIGYRGENSPLTFWS